MPKRAMTMKDFIKLSKSELGFSELSVSIVDAVLNYANSLNITELEVDKREMGMAVQWYLACSGDMDEEKPKIIRENRIDKLLGIKLILN